MESISIDIGYGHTKIRYKNKEVKIPTAVGLYTDNGIDYGDQEVYEFEGEKYIVGSDASMGETFTTTDFKQLLKYSPLIIYHILNKFQLANKEMPIVVKTGLALNDLGHIPEFEKRLSHFVINGQEINLKLKIVPQGIGIYMRYLKEGSKVKEGFDLTSKKVAIIDIGFNTINVLSIVKKKFQKQVSKAYPGHGVSSLVRPVKTFIENKFNMQCSDSEINEYVIDESFMFNGVEHEDVVKFIKDEKRKFIMKLFQSVLIEDKKMLGSSHLVIISGGGANFLKGAKLPPNAVIDDDPLEFNNVRGYSYL